ncbi:MAG TPA: AtpZ/AtpI family protein [Anaerolineales bacterium]|nr:AtpZ/AtpI family protein [Anaerolineales bacterium]
MPGDKKRDNVQYAYNLTLAAVAGQVGCLTLIIIIASLFIGLWLDIQFDTKPMFTIIIMIASVPVTLGVMFWVVKNATSRIQTVQPEPSENSEVNLELNQEREDSGE